MAHSRQRSNLGLGLSSSKYKALVCVCDALLYTRAQHHFLRSPPSPPSLPPSFFTRPTYPHFGIGPARRQHATRVHIRAQHRVVLARLSAVPRDLRRGDLHCLLVGAAWKRGRSEGRRVVSCRGRVATAGRRWCPSSFLPVFTKQGREMHELVLCGRVGRVGMESISQGNSLASPAPFWHPFVVASVWIASLHSCPSIQARSAVALPTCPSTRNAGLAFMLLLV